MTSKEIDRHNIVKRLLEKQVNGTQAANLLKLSVRQIKRLKARVNQLGPKGLIHASRGKPSNRRIPDLEKEKKGLLWRDAAV